MAIYIESSGPEEKGEHEFFRRMIKDLPKDWVIIGNPMYRWNGKSYEIDALITAPGLLWVIEIKNWHGSITGDEQAWILSRGQSISNRKNPIPLLLKKMRKLLTPIKACTQNVYVDARLVMMAGKRSELKIRPDDSRHILYIEETKAFLLNESKKNPTAAWTSKELKELIETFSGNRGVRALSVGGDSLKPLKKSSQSMVTLKQPGAPGFPGFERVYYSDRCNRILIGANELRGAEPALWKEWSHQGVFLHFDGPEASLEAQIGIQVTLNDTLLCPGLKYPIDIARGSLNLQGIELNYTVEPCFN